MNKDNNIAATPDNSDEAYNERARRTPRECRSPFSVEPDKPSASEAIEQAVDKIFDFLENDEHHHGIYIGGRYSRDKFREIVSSAIQAARTAPSEDTKRLDWLEHIYTSVNVVCGHWPGNKGLIGSNNEIGDRRNVRQAIDAAMNAAK